MSRDSSLLLYGPLTSFFVFLDLKGESHLTSGTDSFLTFQIRASSFPTTDRFLP